MHLWKSWLVLLGIIGISAATCFAGSRPVHASASLNTTLATQIATSSISGIREIRIDQTNGTVYVPGASRTSFGALSSDGSSFSLIDYSSSLGTNSASDSAVSSSQVYTTIFGGSFILYRHDISGSTANLITSNALSSGTSALTLGDDGTVYVSKSSTVSTYDPNLTFIASTTVVTVPARMTYGGGNLFYLSTAGRFSRLILDGSGVAVNGVTDIALATGGPTSASIKGFSVSSDGSALYYASNSLFGKISTASGSTLWTKSVSTLAGMDIDKTTGRIWVATTNGSVSVYDPINPVTSVSISPSNSDAVLNWTSGASGADFSGVTIRRSTSSYPASITDGVAVTSSNTGTSFTDSGLSNGTYYYSFFNQTLDGYYSSAATSSVTIAVPPEAPLVSTDAVGSTVHLTWSVPARTQTFVLRRSTSDFPTTYTDETAVTTTDSGITSYTEIGLSDGTYYYSLFAADPEGNYSVAGTSTISVDTTAPTAPDSFAAVASSDAIHLSWINPVDADFASITVRRSTTDFPTSKTDGSAVTSGTVTSHTDTSLADGTYYYSIFAEDSNGNVSTRATASAIVNTYVAPVPVVVNTTHAGGGAIGGSSAFVVPSMLNAAPPNFWVSHETAGAGDASQAQIITSSPALVLKLNADPATVRGYAVSLDPLFTHAGLFPLNASGNVTFTLPPEAGTYTVYLKYFSLSGDSTDVISRTVTYAPALPSPTVPSPAATVVHPIGSPAFTRTLKQGDRGTDVKALQVFLNTHGFIITKTGAGSPGNETLTFGNATAKALAKFQEANRITLLKPFNLTKGTGIFGIKTRELINLSN